MIKFRLCEGISSWLSKLIFLHWLRSSLRSAWEICAFVTKVRVSDLWNTGWTPCTLRAHPKAIWLVNHFILSADRIKAIWKTKILEKHTKLQILKSTREFPDCPVVRTWCFHWLSGALVQSLFGELRSCKPCSTEKKKKKIHQFTSRKSKANLQNGENICKSCIW